MAENTGQKTDMPFFEHIEALRWHLVRSIVVVAVLGIVGYRLFGDNSACIQAATQELINTDLAGQFTMHMWVSFIGGVILGMPYVLWELWKFISPALRKTETKPVKGFVVVSTILFLMGVGFSYFLVFPLTWNFLAPYAVSNDVKNLISFDSYVSNLTTLTLAFGLVFEMPVVVYFISRLGLLTPAFMRKYRRHAVVVILILAAFITPTSDIPTMMAVFVPLYMLYEASIFVSAYVNKKYYA